MNGSNQAVTKGRFRLIQGGGAQTAREAERLDRFLAEADPLLVAPPRKGNRRPRYRHGLWVWSFVLLLGLTTVVPFLHSAAGAARTVAHGQEQARLLVEEGRRLLDQDRDDAAFAAFNRAVQLAPDDADAWADLAACQMRNFQSILAERAFQRALALEPAHKQALHGLGNLYLRRGEEKKAEELWRRGGLDLPLARLYLLQGRFQEAGSRLAAVRARGAVDPLVDRMAAAAWARHLDPYLRSQLEPEPTGRSIWAELGWRLARQKSYGEASAAFERAVAEVPTDVNALSGLGLSLLALNRSAEAQGYFERALRLDDDHLRSLNGLADCLRREGRTGEAIALWRETLRRYPGIGVNNAAESLAWTYYDLRDYRRAALYFTQVVRKHPSDSQVVAALNAAVQHLAPPQAD